MGMPPQFWCESGTVGVVRRAFCMARDGEQAAIAVLTNQSLTALATRAALREEGSIRSRYLHARCTELHHGVSQACTEGKMLTDASDATCSCLHAGHVAAELLLTRTKRLREQLADYERQQAIMASFRHKYSLCEADESLLNLPFCTHTVENVAHLLAVLEQVHDVRSRAIALSTQHSLRLQLEMVMAAHAERGYAWLFRWLEGQSRMLPVRAGAPVLAPLGHAISTLRAHPILLRSCIDEMAVGRQRPLLVAVEERLCSHAAADDDNTVLNGTFGVGAPCLSGGGVLEPLNSALTELQFCLSHESVLFNMLLSAGGATNTGDAVSGTDCGGCGAGSASCSNLTALAAALVLATALVAAPVSHHLQRILSPPPESPCIPGAQLAMRHRLVALLQQHTALLERFLECDRGSQEGSSELGTPHEQTLSCDSDVAMPTRQTVAINHSAPLLGVLRACSTRALADLESLRTSLVAQLHHVADNALCRVVSSTASPPALHLIVSDAACALQVLLEEHTRAATDTVELGQQIFDDKFSTFLAPLAHTTESTVPGLAPEPGPVLIPGARSRAAAGARTMAEAISSVTDARAAALVGDIVSAALSSCKRVAQCTAVQPAVDVPVTTQERLISVLNVVEMLCTRLFTNLDQNHLHEASAAGPSSARLKTLALGAVQASGTCVSAASLRILTAERKLLLDELAREAAQALFAECGLAPKLAALQTAASQHQYLVMADIVGLEQLALTSAMRSFYGIVFRRGDELMPQSKLPLALSLRRQATVETARTIVSTYQHIYDLIQSPGSGYSAPESILLHTPGEVEVLLGL